MLPQKKLKTEEPKEGLDFDCSAIAKIAEEDDSNSTPPKSIKRRRKKDLKPYHPETSRKEDELASLKFEINSVTTLPRSVVTPLQNQLGGINNSLNRLLGLELLKFEESLAKLQVAYEESDVYHESRVKKCNYRARKDACELAMTSRSINFKKKSRKVKRASNSHYEEMLVNYDCEFKRSHDMVCNIDPLKDYKLND